MKTLGSIEIITFKTNRYEHSYFQSFLALLYGTSTGHIALRITFNDTQLYNQYIKNNAAIPHRTYLDPKDHKPVYEVYVSFWPAGEWAPRSNAGVLKPYHFDCIQSGNFSAFDYNPEMTEYLKPIEKLAVSAIPGFDYLSPTKITLPPTITLHTDRLRNKFGNDAAVCAEEYCVAYHAWRSALAKEENFKLAKPDDTDLIAEYAYYTKQKREKMLTCQNKLSKTIFPNIAVSSVQELYNELEQFVTFGYPERDVVTLPLTKSPSSAGIYLEPMLKHICLIATSPTKFPYNVLASNCARTIYDILLEGCKNTKFNQILKALTLPWFVRWFSITITPTLIMKLVAKLQLVIDMLKPKIVPLLHTQPALEKAIAGDVKQKKQSEYDPELTPVPTNLAFYGCDQNENDATGGKNFNQNLRVQMLR